jgi:type VI secretion system protein ImpL
MLYQQAQQFPDPLRKWLFSVADNTWQLILNSASLHLESVWASQVFPKYQELQSYFPFNPKSTVEASLGESSTFFAADGILDKYIKEDIKPFLKPNLSPLEWNSMYGHSITDSSQKLALINNLLRFKQLLFSNSEQTIRFMLKPLTLSANAASLHVQIGDETMIYRHGPLQAKSFKWLLATPIDIRITFSDFNDQQQTKVYSGTWSLLKLINSSTFQPTKQPDHYLLAINSNNYSATFDLFIEKAQPLLDISMRKSTSLHP